LIVCGNVKKQPYSNRNDAEQVRKNRMFYLLDTYLNTPDKFLNETPLHFASKFGSLDILELFLSFHECDRERKNTRGETPADVIIIFYSILHQISNMSNDRFNFFRLFVHLVRILRQN
jgi:ankyrin repeat protein